MRWAQKAQDKPQAKNGIVGVIYIVAAVLLWSFIPLLIKQVSPPFDPQWVAALRLALGAGFIAIAERVVAGASSPSSPGPRHWRRREQVLLIFAGAAIAGDYLLYTAGIRLTTASAGNLVVQIEIIALSLWGLIILKESAGAAKLAGMALCFSGVFLVAWNGQGLTALARSEYSVGNLIVAAGGMCWSFYALGQKMLLETRGAGQTVVPIMLIGAGISVAVAIFSPLATRPPTSLQWALLIGLGSVCTGLAYFLMVRGLQRLEASHVALLATLNPVLTMTEAHFLLGEKLSGFLLGGAGLIVAGVCLIAAVGSRVSRPQSASAVPETRRQVERQSVG